MPPRRRDVLGGIGAAWLSPALARAAPPPPAAGAALRAALDDARQGDAATGLRRLERFDAAGLHGGDRLDLTVARAGLAIDAAIARDHPFGRRSNPYRVTPLGGAWRADRPDAAAIDAETTGLVADAAAGVMLPLAALDATVAALRTARRIVPADVATAIDRQTAALAAMRDRTSSLPGIGRLANGAAWYGLLLRRGLGNDATPEAGERRLLAELERQTGRADALFARIGRRTGSVAERYAVLWQDARFLYSASDVGRSRAIADMAATLAELRTHVPAMLGAVPPWCLDVAVRGLDAAEIAGGRSGYREVPTPTRPGAYVVDLRAVRRRPRWTLPGVVAHELLPGHMIQLGIEGVAPPHPLRRDYAAAFVEGWGIHAEEMAADAGVYADPQAELGHVHWLLFRIVRALVDIGIHLHGWTLAEAGRRFATWLGEPAYFAPFDVELARIPLEPASRAAEALAWLAIADGARRRHGPALVAYRRALLADGRKRTEDLPVHGGRRRTGTLR